MGTSTGLTVVQQRRFMTYDEVDVFCCQMPSSQSETWRGRPRWKPLGQTGPVGNGAPSSLFLTAKSAGDVEVDKVEILQSEWRIGLEFRAAG